MDYDESLFSPHWFKPFCNKSEAQRIFTPKDKKDYFLRKRASIVADNSRYTRVYRNKARLMGEKWSFENSFIDSHYKNVLKRLSKEDRIKCKDVLYGDIFSNDVNGFAAIDENCGRIICLNESLQFFLKFCHLSLLDFEVEVPEYVRQNALRIALRILIQNETMDFFMDPRGIVPKCVGKKILYPISSQLQFIAGHEFAHHLCGHLKDDNVRVCNILSVNEKTYTAKVYNVSQKQEFDADIESICRPKYNQMEYNSILNGSLLWFIALMLGEKAESIIDPSRSFKIQTHPKAEDRFYNIIDNVQIPKKFRLDKIKRIKDRADSYLKFIEEDISVNYEIYEVYGSYYLDEPETEWRGKALIDRVDYY